MANIGIIGAGVAGLTAAYDLIRAGHQVTLYEAALTWADGAGFKDERWEWSLEHFYHHIFASDRRSSRWSRTGIGDTLLFPTR
jgi:protoporphyrinogen oxidase